MEIRKWPGGSTKWEESILWKLSIPNAAKKIFWRVCQNLLPTKENLLRRKVVKEPFCPISEQELKTILHALWDCSAARDIWGCSRRVFQKMTMEGRSFMQTMESIFSKCDLDDFAMFAQLSCHVWFCRNKWVHEGTFVDPNLILQKTVEDIMTYAQLQQKEPAENNVSTHLKAWLAPTQGWYKANWDVAIDKLNERVGIGVVLRDEKGQVIATMCKTRMGILELAMGEAYAAYHAVFLCRDMGVQNLILEGNVKQIVEAINSATGTWSLFGHLIEDTRRVLLTLPRWNCVFVSHEANEEAHRMAKVATTDVNDRIWRGTTPNCISDIILMEQLALSR
ncbi:uncharacterized protein LOC132169617 [Corylus avellana]|uniref:uncharacterized protein LOC132169617 n=1 Tax=Corylus avellana TaxID=13451 RepID=UPI00286BFFA0|nr:uncharacterized protein LOC132169617 [Corylus avellana]